MSEAAKNIQNSGRALATVVIMVNNPKTINSALSYLRPHYNLVVVSRMGQLVEALQVHRPRVVLLSWNLKNIDTKKLFSLMTKLFKISTIVFGEDSSKSTTSKLMTSGIPQFLLAPLSGPTVHSRIQSYMTPSPSTEKKIFLNDEADLPPPVKVPTAEVPKALEWKEEASPHKGPKKMWKAEIKDEETGSFGGTYLYRGKDAPRFDSKRKAWNFSENDGSVFFRKEKSTLPPSEIKTEKPIDQLSDWDIESLIDKLKTEIQVDISADEKLGSVTSTNIDDASVNPGIKTPDSVLAQALKTSYEKSTQPHPPSLNDQTMVSKVTLCSISSQRFFGYLICVSTQDEFQLPYMEKMKEVLMGELDGLGEVNVEPINIYEVEITPTLFKKWVQAKADFYITSEKSDIALAFFSTPERPVIKEDGENIGISVKKDLVPETNLDFDLYIHLPQNKRYLHYIREGQSYTKANHDRFANFRVETCYIPKNQKNKFLKYLAKMFIKSSL